MSETRHATAKDVRSGAPLTISLQRCQLQIGQIMGNIAVNSIHCRIAPQEPATVRAFCFSGIDGGRKTRRRGRCWSTCRAPHPQSSLQVWLGPRHLSTGGEILAQRRKTTPMQEIRCGSCNRKLGVGEYTRLTIKCPRCGCMNVMKAERLQSASLGAPDTEGANVWLARPTNDR